MSSWADFSARWQTQDSHGPFIATSHLHTGNSDGELRGCQKIYRIKEMKQMKLDIPMCCGNALEPYLKVPGFEYRCPECKALYQFFDGFERVRETDLTEEQKTVARLRGWDIA